MTSSTSDRSVTQLIRYFLQVGNNDSRGMLMLSRNVATIETRVWTLNQNENLLDPRHVDVYFVVTLLLIIYYVPVQVMYF